MEKYQEAFGREKGGQEIEGQDKRSNGRDPGRAM